jgi:hypothetical protein
MYMLAPRGRRLTGRARTAGALCKCAVFEYAEGDGRERRPGKDVS